jgi:outer membrane autotransporter protein
LLTSVAGVKYSFAIENDWAIKLQPELRAALTYDLISEADAAVIDMPGVASYAVEGKQMNRLGGEFGIGLTADYQGLKVTLMYDLDLHKDYTSQTGMIKFRTQF